MDSESRWGLISVNSETIPARASVGRGSSDLIFLGMRKSTVVLRA